MFVITELEDRVEIKAAAWNKKASVEEQLHKKYVNKLVGDLGQAMAIHSIISIASYEIHSNILVATVTFQVLFYRFYSEEICIGKILHQDEGGIIVGDSIFKKYEIQASDLFENCDFMGEDGNWVWNYKGNRLVFYKGDLVRLRIKRMRYEDSAVSAYMNEQGLGPCSWWD